MVRIKELSKIGDDGMAGPEGGCSFRKDSQGRAFNDMTFRRGSEAERRQQAIAVSGESTPGISPQEWKALATSPVGERREG